MKEKNIIIFGRGKLASYLKIEIEKMNASKKVIAIEENEDLKKYFEDNSMTSSVIAISDFIDTNLVEELEKSIPTNMHYKYVFGMFDEIIISNSRSSGDEGCVYCLYKRWATTKKERIQYLELMDSINNEKPFINYNLEYNKAVIILISRLVSNNKSLNSQVCIIDKETLAYRYNEFLPVPTCEKCGVLPVDSKSSAIGDFQGLLSESNQNEYRIKNIEALKDVLINEYVNNDLGVLKFVLDDIEAPFAVSVASLPLINGKDEVGVGRTKNYLNSRSVAILEALERYCGMEPRGKKTKVYDCYKNIQYDALNPFELGLHTKDQYKLEGFPFKQFNLEERINWVWGYSLNRSKPILVPESIAYYGLNVRDTVNKNFVYEISNGCSLGGSMLEAVLFGIFEVIERDAFLITWYNRLSVPRLNVRELKINEIDIMVEKFEYLFNYKLYFFDITLDTQVPTVLALAKNNEDNELMNIMCAAGCHLSMEKAIMNAVHELCDILPALNKKFIARKEDLHKMLDNYNLIKTMEDHSLIGGLKESEKNFEFLFNNENISENNDNCKLDYTGVIHKDFKCIIDKLRDLNLDVITVNQTAKELDKNNLFCAKVLIPGMLPMTFGHVMRRIDNLKRVYEVPNKLGYKSIVGKSTEKICPHPFP